MWTNRNATASKLSAGMRAGDGRPCRYRDSKLTYLLSHSLGGNARTTLLAALSPTTANASETTGTLLFAQRASLVVNPAKANTIPHGDSQLKRMQEEIRQLNEQLQVCACPVTPPLSSLPAPLSPPPLRGQACLAPPTPPTQRPRRSS